VTVLVLVLVLIDVLTDVLVSTDVVVVGAVVVSVEVDGGVVVSVTVCVGPTCGADAVVGVVVVVVVVFVELDEPDIRLITNHTIRASMSAMIAPNATRAAGLRYQGTCGSVRRARLTGLLVVATVVAVTAGVGRRFFVGVVVRVVGRSVARHGDRS